jgi:hypothetical protein
MKMFISGITVTIKEIAELCGRAQSTIRNWIASANSAEISAKIAEARITSKPASFTLDETLVIIRAGGNEILANLLAENVRNRKNDEKYLSLMEGLRGEIAKIGTKPALPDPKELAYQELTGFVETNLIITGNHKRDMVYVGGLYDTYRGAVDHVLPEKAFMHKIVLDNPEIELIKKRSWYEFAGCCKRY